MTIVVDGQAEILMIVVIDVEDPAVAAVVVVVAWAEKRDTIGMSLQCRLAKEAALHQLRNANPRLTLQMFFPLRKGRDG